MSSSFHGIDPVSIPAGNDPPQVTIRGVSLRLDDLLDPKLSDQAYLDGLRVQLASALPFPHVVIEGWFNPGLLDLVVEEFDDLPRAEWKTQFNNYARVERSRTDARLGPASQLYFSLIHSSFFLSVLSYVSGVTDLVPDPHLFGGGLHETLPGGSFGIHIDFDRHPRNALNNEMVFITYLNKDWQPEWNGALELWDGQNKQCEETVEPEFGRSILMTHGKTHFHGHSKPLAPPAGRTRRSIAAYFYANRFAREDRRQAMLSKFLFSSKQDRRKEFAKQFLPPILVAAFKRLAKR
jgi:hypothetical protein